MAGVHASAALPNSLSGPVRTQMSSQNHLSSRRTPPRAVDLLSSNKRRKHSHSPDTAQALIAPITQLHSQGSGSDESASHWFEKSNKHVAQSAKASADHDDEPPFFIANQTSYLPSGFAPSEGSRLFGTQSRLDSENEDLRGVIDDLTVENKRLKHVLRASSRSARNSPSLVEQDKLFEVRIHGLTSEKRRELEYLLKNFATSVHTPVPSFPNSSQGSNNSVSQNNCKAVTDSGYASNSNSGQPALTRPPINPVSHSARDKSIKNYLHDIPDTLLPRQQPMVMSDRARMALVVRRLEQLFTGRKAVPGEHIQPLQQQEVSQMAARADAQNTKKRKIEGSREAHILPPDSKINFDAIDSGPEKGKSGSLKPPSSDDSAASGSRASMSRPGSPDQRPTRPLDLDIHRAQVAAENIQYIRHLGLSSPHLNSTDSDDSWVYLNLLISMAQLHTINVTPDFVRRSVRKLSSKFELSKDGHKVRWIGGHEGTVFSREDERALEIADNKAQNSPDESNEDLGTGGSSRRSKTDSNSNAVQSNTATSEDKTSGLRTNSTSKQQISTAATSNQVLSMQTRPTQSGSAFDYKPIVYRERTGELGPEDSYLQDTDSSRGSSSRDSSGLAHALSRSNLNRQRKSDEGLITFYNNPFFCSDYSGDKMPRNMVSPRDAAPGFVLGIHPGDDWEGQACRLAAACYFTPDHGPAPFRPSKEDHLPELSLAPLSRRIGDERQPIELPVSGLGGILPDDNFAIDASIHMVEVPSDTKPTVIKEIPRTGTKVKSRYKHELATSQKIDLLPSRLPPPSYIFFTSSSSSGNQIGDDESSDDSDESSSANNDAPPPPTFLQHWSADDSGEIGADEYDERDDSSVDMLAAARAVDPARIAEEERQYMINQPGGRAVAGSLAATVGASHSASSRYDVNSVRAEAVSDGEDENSVMDVDN